MADLSYLLGPTQHERDQRARSIAAGTLSILDEQKQRAAARAAETLGLARRFAPAGAAADQAAALRSSTAIPSGFPLRDPAMIDELSVRINAQRELEYLRAHPKTAGFVSDYDRAIAAHGDIESIGNVESFLNAVSRSSDRTWDGFVLGTLENERARRLETAKNAQKSIDEILADARVDAGVTEEGKKGDLVTELSAGAKGLWQYLRSIPMRMTLDEEQIQRMEGYLTEDLEDVVRRRGFEADERALLWGTAEWRRDIEQRLGELKGKDFAESVTGLAGIAGSNPGRFLQYMLEIGAESGVILLASGVTAAATRNPAAVAAVTGVGSYTFNSAAKYEELIADRGYDISTMDGVSAYLADPKTRLELRDKTRAYAITVAIVDALSAGAAGVALSDNPVGNMALQLALQGTLGGASEFLGMLAAGEEIDWTEVIMEGLAEFTTAPWEVGQMSVASASKKLSAVGAAKERSKLFKILGGQLEASTLRAKDRETFKAAIDAVAKGGPSENVYVDPASVEEMFQSGDVGIKEFFDAVPELDYADFIKARDNGDLYVIPTSVYAASIAGTEIGARLMDHVKMRPDDVSTSEARTFAQDLKQAQADLEANSQKLETAMGALDGPLAEEMERLTAEIVMATGFAPDLAARQAAPLIAAARVGATRTGIPVAEYLRKYTLPIVRNADTVGPAPVRPTVYPGAILDAVHSGDPAADALPGVSQVRELLDNQGVDPETASLEAVHGALKELIDGGMLVAELPIEDMATPSTLDRPEDGDEYMQSATLRGGEEDLAEWGIDPTKRNKTRDIALKLQDRQRKLYGKTNRRQRGAKTIDKFGEWMADEIEFELQTPGQSARGWYGPKFQAALDKLGAVWAPLVDEGSAKKSRIPGVKTQADARALATALFAVSSNGTKVVQNVDNAIALLLAVEEDGRLVESVAHHRGAALNDHIITMFRLAEELGGVGMQEHLTETRMMSEINKELRAEGKATKSGYPADMAVPNAAMYLGPKLAAFYANLTGAEGYLTMDLWWTRSINRYRGDVLPRVTGLKNGVDSKGKPIGLHRFKVLIGRPDLSDSQALNYATEYAETYEKKGFKNGTTAEKAANTLYKAAFNNLAEEPEGAADRTFMIEVARAAQAKVFERTGEYLSIADVQAIMWYYEKRLYADMGVRDSGDLSYEEAAEQVTQKRSIEAKPMPAGPQPLPGAPTVEGASGPDLDLVRVAERYASGVGMVLRRQAVFAEVDPQFATRIAQAYDQMAHNPTDPEVAAAYEDLIRQTRAQYDALVDAGYSFTFFDGESDPYQGNPWGAMRELRANKTMAVFGTYAGYGTEGVTDTVDDNPLLAETGLEWPDQAGKMRPVLANDLFRAVHDAFGHGIEGAGFRARGEENAWQAHARLFYGPALAALTTETRGQNSWLNYGPHGAKNRTASVEDTVFAEQKTGLLPSWAWTDRRVALEGDDPGQVNRDPMTFEDRLNAAMFGGPDDVFYQSNEAIPVSAEEMDPERLYEMSQANPASLLALFKRPGWYVVTAARTEYGDNTSPENVERNNELLAALREKGRTVYEMEGVYKGTPDGASFLVIGSEDEATTLGRIWGQESVLTNKGLVFTDGSGTENVPFSGVKFGHEARYEDYHSTFKGKLPVYSWSLKLDFPSAPDVTVDDGMGLTHYGALVEDGRIRLTHWSKEPRTVLDPAAAGTGDLPGPERRRLGPKKTFYGLHIGQKGGYTREGPSLGDWRHEVFVDAKDMYPWWQDPDGLKAKIDRSQINEHQIGQYENLIKEAGYKGYFVIGGPLGDTAVLFGAADVDGVFHDNSAKALRSREFNEWFADSGVTNDDGSPRMVYHATRAGTNFGAFRRFSHFGTLRAAHQRMHHDEVFERNHLEMDPQGRSRERVIPVYLSLQKPLFLGRETTSYGDLWETTSDVFDQVATTLGGAAESQIRAVLEREYDVPMLNGYGEPFQDGRSQRLTFERLDREMLQGFVQDPELQQALLDGYDEVAEIIENAGYDSLTYVNEIEDAGSISYIALRPGQVKSPFNRGSFDFENSDILFQGAPMRPLETDAFKAWFKNSAVVDKDGNPLPVFHGTEGEAFTAFDTTGRGRTAGTGAFFTSGLSMAATYSGTTRRVNPDQSVQDMIDDGELVMEETADGFAIRWPVELITDPPIATGATKEEALRNAFPELSDVLGYSSFAGKRMYEVYLSIQNPLEIDAHGANWSSILVDDVWVVEDENGGVAGYLESPDMLYEEFGRDPGLSVRQIDPASDEVYTLPEYLTQTTNEIVREARESGYFDGVIIRNVMDGGPYSRGGEEGDVFVAFEPGQIKSVDNFGTWDALQENIYEQAVNGAIVLPKDLSGDAIIKLFETANLSTMLHETGHFFLWQLQRQMNDGYQFAADEMAGVKKWWLSNSGAIAAEAGVDVAQVEEYLTVATTGSGSVDQAIHRALHEQFARGFEAYLMEGKAPSNVMRALFEDFAAWLMSWYRHVKNLNVDLNDDIRGVFDRMLATEEELLDAAEREEINDMIATTAKEMGLDQDSYARLVALSQEARDEGRQLARKEFLATERRIRSAEYQARFAEIEAEERAKARAKPVHRAIQMLAYGRWLGDDAPVDMPLELRMDADLLAEEHGTDILAELPRGRRPVFKKDTGLSADEVAGWFGFNSGAEMLEAMKTAPKLNDEVKQATEARAREEIGETLNDPDEVAQVVADAYHGEKRGQVIVAELRAINRLGGRNKKMTTRAQAKAIAMDLIWKMPVREATQSSRYLAAERMHSEKAMRELAAGNVEAAFDAKRKQLIQHEMYIESRKVDELKGKAEKLAGKLKRKGTRENLAPEYLGAIDDILETYDFRKISGVAEGRRERLNAYVQMMTAAGRADELSIPDHVLQNAKRIPYKTLTSQRLKGVYDSLRNIEHMARRRQKLYLAAEQRQLQEVRDEIAGQFASNVKRGKVNRSPSKVDGIVSGTKGYINLVRNADTILRRIDGWASRGAMARFFKQDIDDAGAKAQIMREKATADLDAIFSVYSRGEKRQMAVRKMWKGYDQALSKWDVISIALNMGNKDNRERLMSKDSRGSFTQTQVDALLDNLDKRDFDFVQSVWDYLDREYWPLIRAREERVTGVAPEKVPAEPLQTRFGEYRGGYYPIVYDKRYSAKVREDQNADLMTSMMAGRFGKAQTRNGHTKARAGGGGGRTVQLGMHVLFGHVNTVIHDLAFGEAVNTTWKLLQDQEVKALFETYNMLEDHHALELWVQDVAAGPAAGTHALAQTAKRLKSGFTLSKLAFNMSTVAIQLTGVTQSMATIGSTNVMKGYLAYLASARNPFAIGQEIKERSTFMREREVTFQRDAYDIARDVQLDPIGGVKADVMRFLTQAGFFAMQKVQYYGVDVPTWLGAHQKGISEGMSEADAARYADRMVARAQASGLYADRTAVERGTMGATARQNEFLRLFTALGSYMFAKYNVAEEVVGRTVLDVRDPTKSSVYAVVKATTDLALLFTIEAIFYNLVKGALPGMGDDDDDESWAQFLAAETALSVASVFPFIRDLSSAVQGYSGGGAYGGISETAGRALASLGDVVTGEANVSDLRSLSDFTGLMLPGYPSTAIWRLIDGAGLTGEEPSPLAMIMGR